MQKLKALTYTVLIVLIMSLTALSASATYIAPFTLSASSGQLRYALPAGTTFNGSIQTTGTIRFWVNAPSGAQIVNIGLVDNTATFGFVAQQDGNYSLNFENTLSDPVQVTFSYTTNPDLSGNSSNPLQVLSNPLITVIIIVIGSLVIIFLVRRKNKNQDVDRFQSDDVSAQNPNKT